MERASRAELINTVNTQRDQLQQYKVKLRDIVAAYKSVVKEKEALEASVSALSLSASSTDESDQQPSTSQTDADGHTEARDGQDNDPLGVNKQDGKVEGKGEVSSLRDQIKTLSNALTTLTQEKNKLEANFIADKKNLRLENDELQAKLKSENETLSHQIESLELLTSDMKSRLRTHQLDREKEQTDHALMLRELQSLLRTERATKDQLESQLEEALESVKDYQEQVKMTPQVSEMYENQIKQLKTELKKVKEDLKEAELKAEKTSPIVGDLQKQICKLKEEHQKQLRKEQEQMSDAEVGLKSQAMENEERVSSLEAKLSELSQVVGNYERLRFQDQQTIAKLKERVTQLDMENSALVHAASLNPEKSKEEEEEQTVEQILDKVKHYRLLLMDASEKSENPVNLADIFVEDMNKYEEDSPVCRQYKEELEKVKEEFERYKLRAQSVLKNRYKDNSSSKEAEVIREQNSELREKLRMANFHHQEELMQFQTKVDSLSKALLTQEEKSKGEIANVKSLHQKEISQLEGEVKKQRDRAIALLSEKDQEIQKLSALTDQNLSSGSFQRINSSSVKASRGFVYENEARDNGDTRSEETEAVNKLLGLPKGLQNEAAFLHFSQEKARMDVEIASLRKHKRMLENTIRENEASAFQREAQLKDEASALEERLAEIDRMCLRENANLEYLKNVLLKYFTSTDWQGRKQMVKALMTILHFSPQEIDKVHHSLSKGWWGSS